MPFKNILTHKKCFTQKQGNLRVSNNMRIKLAIVFVLEIILDDLDRDRAPSWRVSTFFQTNKIGKQDHLLDSCSTMSQRSNRKVTPSVSQREQRLVCIVDSYRRQCSNSNAIWTRTSAACNAERLMTLLAIAPDSLEFVRDC